MILNLKSVKKYANIFITNSMLKIRSKKIRPVLQKFFEVLLETQEWMIASLNKNRFDYIKGCRFCGAHTSVFSSTP